MALEVPKELIITRIGYPKWWKELETAKISLSDAGTQIVVSGRADSLLFIASIVLTVSGETNLKFGFGIFGESGSMDFGGTDEPRGIVIAMGNSPAACGPEGFSVISDGAAIAVGGFVSYYQIKRDVVA